MPIYEYRCDACDNVFEEWHRHADDMTEVPCPACHKVAHRLISNTSFVLKGGGWYVTEYGNRKAAAPAPAGTGEKGASSAAPEAKTETAAPTTQSGTQSGAQSNASSGTPSPAPAAAPAAKTETAAAS